jgi:hypothetical protein
LAFGESHPENVGRMRGGFNTRPACTMLSPFSGANGEVACDMRGNSDVATLNPVPCV